MTTPKDMDDDWGDSKSVQVTTIQDTSVCNQDIKVKLPPRERHPLRINFRNLPLETDEDSVRKVISEAGCCEPNSVFVKTIKKEDQEGEDVCFANVEFAYSDQAADAFCRIRKLQPEWRVGFAFKDSNKRIRDRVVEDDFSAFRETYKNEMAIRADNHTGVNGFKDSRNNHGDNMDVSEMTNRLVHFLPAIETECQTCQKFPDVDHLHFIIADGVIVDPKNAIPDIVDVLCNSCGKESNLKKCGKCGLVNYCSRACQVKDWSKHSQFCSTSLNSSLNMSVNSTGMSFSAASPVISSGQSTLSPNGLLEPIKGPLENGVSTDKQLEAARTSFQKMSVTSPIVKQLQPEVKPLTPKAPTQASTPKASVEPPKLVMKSPQSPVVRQGDVDAPKRVEPVNPPKQVESITVKEPLRRTLPLNVPISRIVVHKTDDGCFFLSDDDAVYNVIAPITENILEKEKSLEVLTPGVGIFCAAKSVDDGVYYRARIDEVMGDKVKVYFIDYGNYNDVPKKDLRALPAVLDPTGIHLPYAIKVKGKDANVQAKISKAYNESLSASFTPESEVDGVYILA